MRIRLVTTVKSPFNKVYEEFNIHLFKYLLPPFNLAEVLKYEGQNPGDIIDIKINVPFMSHWTVIIKDSWLSHREYGFTDRGLRLPLGIIYWKHTHRLVARDNHSCFIIDDLEYESSSVFLDYLLYIPLWMIFYPRKFLYPRYFRRSQPLKIT
jgi:ligand-binding SRPBCC domain-containing protein